MTDETESAKQKREREQLERQDEQDAREPHLATPAPGTYEEPREREDPNHKDAGQALVEREREVNERFEENERRKASSD